MSLTTCNVLCTVHDDAGTPVQGATVSAKLNQFEAYNGYVVPQLVEGTTNASGQVTLALWPNQLGSTESMYVVKISAPNGKRLTLNAVVPNVSNTELHLIAELPPYDGKTEGQLMLDAAVAAGSVATSAAMEAASSATNAATSASNASTAASSSTGSATTATTKAAEAAASATNANSAATIATAKAAEAATSATNAATSATTASIAATTATTKSAEGAASAANAATSATSAAGSATTATTKATEASGSATAAAGSESAAAGYSATAVTKAGEAATSATNAAASASDATNSKNAAATSATSADGSATSAAGSAATANTKAAQGVTSATNAAASATAASGSATTATTKASEASTSATNAATSASNAATSASSASTSATAAGSSATNAATSASTAAGSATSASGSATTATTKASESSISAVTASTKASEAADSATAAAGSATTASTKASEAVASATTATTLASNAATSATNAANSASAASSAKSGAESARDSALAAFANFSDQYLGTYASDPTTDNVGGALAAGNLYFNSAPLNAGGGMKVYDGTNWLVAYASLSGALIGNNNLSDLVSVSAARTNLGLGNVENKNSATIRGELNGANVAAALGFTPYSDANPAGYLTSATAASTFQTILVSGVGIKSLNGTSLLGAGDLSLSDLTAGSYLTGGTFNGSGAATFAVDATSTNTASKVVARDASGNFSANTITATLSGNATSASGLQTSRDITANGDAIWSVSFNGTSDVSSALTLAASGVIAGTYTKVTVDAKGRVTVGAALSSADLPTYTGTITSTQVTAALGFTPYNASNPNSYVESYVLDSYLRISDASLTYQTQLGMSSYLTIASAANTYQTQSGMSSYLTEASATSTYLPLAGGTLAGNLTLASGTKILGDFSNASYTSRVYFQTSTANGSTAISLLPNGTSVNSQINIWGNSDPTNAPLGVFVVNATSVRLQSSAAGTGTIMPLSFWIGASEAARFDATTRNFLLGTTTDNGNDKLQVNGSVSIGITKATTIFEAKVAISAGNIDVVTGSYFTKTISAATALSVSNVPGPGNSCSFILELTNAGAYTITWWSGIKWASGTAPSLTASGVDLLGFVTVDGGTTWRGTLISKDSR